MGETQRGDALPGKFPFPPYKSRPHYLFFCIPFKLIPDLKTLVRRQHSKSPRGTLERGLP